MRSSYSQRFTQLVNSGDTNKLGVQFGNLCIEHDIPAKDVAEHFNVSLTTVHNWFKGLSLVSSVYQEPVTQAVKTLLDKRK